MMKKNMSDREFKRGDSSRPRRDQSHRRFLSPEVRTNGGERGPSRVPENGGMGEIGLW